MKITSGDTLYSFEVAVAPSMLNSASPVLILHPQYFYPKASRLLLVNSAMLVGFIFFTAKAGKTCFIAEFNSKKIT